MLIKSNLLCSYLIYILKHNKNEMKTFEKNRLTIYTSDLQRITGRSERTCQRIINEIKDMFGLNKRQLVTVRHASEYLGIPVSEIHPFIR